MKNTILKNIQGALNFLSDMLDEFIDDKEELSPTVEEPKESLAEVLADTKEEQPTGSKMYDHLEHFILTVGDLGTAVIAQDSSGFIIYDGSYLAFAGDKETARPKTWVMKGDKHNSIHQQRLELLKDGTIVADTKAKHFQAKRLIRCNSASAACSLVLGYSTNYSKLRFFDSGEKVPRSYFTR